MMDAPTPPPTPDPYRTAAAQTQGDVQSAIATSALQNANTYSPQGSSVFNQIGTITIRDAQGNPIEVPRWEQRTSLSPEQQALYDQQVRAGQGMNDLAISQIARLQGTLGAPIDTSNLPPAVNSLPNGPSFNPLQTSFSAGTQPISYGFDSGGPLTRSYDTGGPIQHSVNMASAPTTFGQTAGNVRYNVGADDFSADRDRVVQALFSRLQPAIDRDRLGLEQRLSNQGVAQGSEAWNRAIDASTRQANDGYMQALLAGGQEQSRLFGLDLAQGTFNNQAQNQDYSQLLGRGQFNQQGTSLNNAATLAAGQFTNSAQGQQNAQNSALAAFENAVQGQSNTQNQNAALFNNAAQLQQYGQNFDQANFGNNATTQNNAALQQQYQNSAAAAAFANTSRERALQEQLSLRNQPINEIASLLSGGQVSMPQFASYQGASIPQSTIGANIYNSAALDQQRYQQQQQAYNAQIGGLFGLGSSALLGLTGMPGVQGFLGLGRR